MKITQPAKDVPQPHVVKKENQQQSSWQKMLHGIVRPPRSTCKDPLRNCKTFRMNESTYYRNQHVVMHNGKKIQLVVFDPEFKGGWVILYLHGNSSSKVEAYSIREFLPHKFSLAAFDFMGCGNNYQEDSVTLGYRQSQQVQTVVGFLRQKGYKVILWGRSMGAATSLKYGKTPIIVADSAFKSFKSVCRQVAKKNSPCFIPNCLISCLFPCVFSKIRSDVEQKGHYDVQELDIGHAVCKINPKTVIFFLTGDDDTLIDRCNSQKLYNMYVGKNKYLQVFKGTHNTKRPPDMLRKVMSQIEKHTKLIQNQESKASTTEFLKYTPR